jgi:hypothetical protein
MLVFMATHVRAAPIDDSFSSADEVVAAALQFRQAVLRRDQEAMSRWTAGVGGFGDQARQFVYNDDFARKSLGARANSLYSLLASDNLRVIYQGPIGVNARIYPGRAYIVYFFPARDPTAPSDNVVWLAAHGKWMVDYAACVLIKVGDSWTLHQSLCFDETEGP